MNRRIQVETLNWKMNKIKTKGDGAMVTNLKSFQTNSYSAAFLKLS